MIQEKGIIFVHFHIHDISGSEWHLPLSASQTPPLSSTTQKPELFMALVQKHVNRYHCRKVNYGETESFLLEWLNITEQRRCQPMLCQAVYEPKQWNQLKCPPADEWTLKMWYIYVVLFHSAIKENKPMNLKGKWMELENIIVTEVVRVQKDKQLVFSFVWLLAPHFYPFMFM